MTLKSPAIPHAFSFQVSLPQPVLISPAVVSSPKELVIAIPVGITFTLVNALSFPKTFVNVKPVKEISKSEKAVSLPNAAVNAIPVSIASGAGSIEPADAVISIPEGFTI